MMKQREIDAEIARKEEAIRQAELDEDERLKPPPDPLYGMRVHAWVLVLAGKREISESFFIEPLTGRVILLCNLNIIDYRKKIFRACQPTQLHF